MPNLLSLAVTIGFFGALAWSLRTLARIQQDQAALFSELERIARALGVPPRQQPMISCPRCNSLYAPSLTGCPQCGSAKPRSPAMVLVPVPAADHTLELIPGSAHTDRGPAMERAPNSQSID